MLTWTRIKSLFLIIFFLLKAATSLSQWTRASAQKNYHPAVRSSLDGTPWQAAPCWSSLRLWICAVSDRSHETLAICGASTCSLPQNSSPALGPTRPIFCSASSRCACCVWKRRLWAVMSHCSGNNRRTKSVKQVGDLLDGCQQGRFGGAFRCVEDPVRGGQTHWAVTEKYRWLQQGLRSAEFTWCGHRCKKWELGFLCLGRNMRCLYLNYVLVAQRQPCSWNSGICCRKSLPSYGKDQNIYRKKIKPTEFIEFMSSLLENILQKYLTYLFSATRRYCLCTGWTLTQRRTLVLSEWRDSWEFLCVQILPMKSQESTTQSCCHLIKPQKEIKWETRVLPWGAPINDSNVSI